ncbi:MAG: HD domain-containing protein [Candidatus Omnitrophica bacterium]|nr:HD domain-containing protein [Candidatus Omnitrophota bacterium]
MNTKNYLTLTKKYKTALSAIHIIARLINSTTNIKELLLRVARLACQVVKGKNCQIIISDNNQFISARINAETTKKGLYRRRKKISVPIEKKIVLSGSLILEPAFLGIPLIGDDLMGAIIVKGKTEPKKFDVVDQEILMNLGEQLVMAIKNLRLYDEQEKLLLGSVKTLVSVLNSTSPQAYTHSKNFNHILLAIAEQMHLSEQEIHALLYAGLLHDAGKIDIPTNILTKSTKLTGREFRIIKEHPLKGVKIIKPLQLLKPAIPIIQHHHEKYDGTGYPAGLKKNQIPLGARIMAVADAFEAMLVERPYRRHKMTLSAAVGEMKKFSGTQFDPKVIDALIKSLKAKKLKKYLSGRPRNHNPDKL